VVDVAGKRWSDLRVLDLRCGEGGFALEMAKLGAEVVAVEGRAELAEKAEFARDALRLRNVSIDRGDIRRLSVEEHGFFDVVLALGVLDHLDAPAVFDVAKRLGSVCKGFALIEARLAPRARSAREFDGLVFRGVNDRSSHDAPAFVLTRRSMLGLLGLAGFTSIAETLDPEARQDAPCFLAFKGRRVALTTAPQINAVAPASWSDAALAVAPRGIARLLRRSRR
jgi:SAM-dependent methyltransferase